jgi:pyrimidine operon attenuation protein/uracil phosphoribosyltransferase
MKRQILTKTQVEQKIRRIAFEIFELNFEEKEIILAGIYDRGFSVAQRLAKELESISPIKAILMQIHIDKFLPHQNPVTIDLPKASLEDKVIVVVDDVLNTGRTLAYGMAPFFGTSLRKLQVAVIIDRSHRNYPIHADYVGYTLSTTLNDHVEVCLDDDELSVYLH